jgi:hypothetical protein
MLMVLLVKRVCLKACPDLGKSAKVIVDWSKQKWMITTVHAGVCRLATMQRYLRLVKAGTNAFSPLAECVRAQLSKCVQI